MLRSAALCHDLVDIMLGQSSSTPVRGVLLWGPPGCGKTSSVLELRTRYDPCHFINVDAVVEAIIDRFYTNEWKNAASDPINAQKLYFQVRNVLGFEMLRDQPDSGEKPLPTSLDLMCWLANRINAINTDPILQTQFIRFLFERHYAKFISVPITELYCQFIVWYSNTRHNSFMIESTGCRFDKEWCQSIFGSNAHLRVVYVDDPDVLIKRVSARKGQLINANPARIREAYTSSYGEPLMQAMQSGIFALIDVVDNTDTPYTLCTLTKLPDARAYRLELATNPTAKAREFIDTTLKDLPLNARFFCLLTNCWTDRLR